MDTSQELDEFLEFIYGNQTGYSYVALRPAFTDQWITYFFEWPNDRSKIADFIRAHTRDNEVYYSPALFSKPSAKQEDFKCTQVIWSEYDGQLPGTVDNLPVPSLRIQSSTSGHEHWYWRLSFSIGDRTAAESLLKKVTYATNGDFVWNCNRVLRPPGTVHHESKHTVKTLHKVTTQLRLEDFVSLASLPDELENFTVGPLPDALDTVAKYEWPLDTWKLFRTKEFDQGSRSSALTKLALSCVEMGMENAEAVAILQTADGQWKKFVGRNDRRERLTSLVKYARAKKIKDKIVSTATKLPIFSFKELFEAGVTFDWVLPGVLAKKGSAIIGGPPGIGKTQVSLQAAMHLGLGKEFLGWKPQQEYKTLVLSLEMNHPSLILFMESMKKDLKPEEIEKLHENMHICPLGEPLRLDRQEDQEKVTELMERYKPDGVIIDSLGQAMVGLNNDEDVNGTFNYVNAILRSKYSAFSWFVHFPRKPQIGNKKPKSVSDLFGSVYIGGQVDLAMLLWPVGDGLELSMIKNRLGPAQYPKMLQRTPNLNFKLSSISSAPKEKSSGDLFAM